eukprot:Sspe_Gene.8261::Locus_2820_Transcript_2_2_Confidence_0.600_Length_6861::g.8261::m.8261
MPHRMSTSIRCTRIPLMAHHRRSVGKTRVEMMSRSASMSRKVDEMKTRMVRHPPRDTGTRLRVTVSSSCPSSLVSAVVSSISVSRHPVPVPSVYDVDDSESHSMSSLVLEVLVADVVEEVAVPPEDVSPSLLLPSSMVARDSKLTFSFDTFFTSSMRSTYASCPPPRSATNRRIESENPVHVDIAGFAVVTAARRRPANVHGDVQEVGVDELAKLLEVGHHATGPHLVLALKVAGLVHEGIVNDDNVVHPALICEDLVQLGEWELGPQTVFGHLDDLHVL